MKFNDAISGAVLLALAIAVIAHSRGLPAMPGQFVGPGLFPGLIAAALAVAAVLLIVRGVRARASEPWFHFEAWTRDTLLVVRFAAIPLFVVAYALLSEAVGFVPLAFVGLAVLFLVAGVRGLIALPVSAVATAAVYYAFAVILRVPLPRVDVLGLPF
ncbi:MAG: tripartite tricarboxylate transporter TctB family protein [Alphaproteobacteria bacterium]|nr:tripartite tricarboxylate transporter TctB family protein [Alphaproteobacteria bacterium]